MKLNFKKVTALKERQKHTINSRRRGSKFQRRKKYSMINLQETCLKGRKTWSGDWEYVHISRVRPPDTDMQYTVEMCHSWYHTAGPMPGTLSWAYLIFLLPWTLQGEETEPLCLLWAPEVGNGREVIYNLRLGCVWGGSMVWVQRLGSLRYLMWLATLSRK